MKKFALVFSTSYDHHADRIALHPSGNVVFVRLNLDVPADWSLSFRNGEVLVNYAGGVIGGEEIESVFVRRIPNQDSFRNAIPDVVAEYAEFITQQQFYLFSDCLAVLDSTTRFVNPLASSSRLGKAVQARLAAEVGLVCPMTYMGTSPDTARQFFDAVAAAGRDACTKPIVNSKVTIDGEAHTQFTTRITTEMLASLDTLSYCPTILQEYIPKAYEVRATVVGSEIFAARIDSQLAGGGTATDWRRYNIPKTPHQSIKLPSHIENQLLELQSRLGLFYSAFDLVCTPDGEFVFLETNPYGQWLWIEDLTGLPISKAISGLLTGAANRC